MDVDSGQQAMSQIVNIPTKRLLRPTLFDHLLTKEAILMAQESIAGIHHLDDDDSRGKVEIYLSQLHLVQH